MLFFLVKTVVAFLLIGFAFFFYGNVSDHLFIKGFFCVFLLCAVYWVDVVRFSKIFISYFYALHLYKNNKKEKAYIIFEKLLSEDLALVLPYMALMRFKGDGPEINIEAAKHFCKRAIRNGYYDCFYLLSVINFFGNSLEYSESDKKDQLNKLHSSIASVKAVKSLNVISQRDKIDPDYKECIFYLKEYFRTNDSKEPNYPEACALYGFCLIKGLGSATSNIDLGNKYFAEAELLHSKNLNYLKKCISNNEEVRQYVI